MLGNIYPDLMKVFYTNLHVVGDNDGRGPSLGPSSSPTTRSMAKRIQEDWDSATDGR